MGRKLEFSNGASFVAEITIGTVLESNQMAETKIHSSGGGGIIVNGYGAASAPRISSTTSIRTEFFVSAMDGTERAFLVPGGVQMRGGNLVSVIWAKGRHGAPLVLAVVNQTLGAMTYVANKDPLYFKQLLGMNGKVLTFGAVLFLLVGSFMAMILGHIFGFFVGLVLFAVSLAPVVLLVRKSKRLERETTRYLDELSQESVTFMTSVQREHG